MARNRTYALKKSVIWHGAWYYRKGSKTWRNNDTGQVVSGTSKTGPKGVNKGYELAHTHVYGADSTKGITAKLKTKKELFNRK